MGNATLEVEQDENTKITTFTETKGEPVTPQDLTEAEEEVGESEQQDKEDDEQYREEHSRDEGDDSLDIDNQESMPEDDTDNDLPDMYSHITQTTVSSDDATLSNLSYYELQNLRFISPKSLDAADAAIIDNEIEPAEPTETAGGSYGSSGGGDFGGGDEFGGDEFGMGGEDEDMNFSFQVLWREHLKNPKYIAGTENLILTGSYVAEAGIKVGSKVFHWIAKYGTKLFRGVVRTAEHAFVSTEKLGKLYEFKLSKMMSAVDDDVLDKEHVDAFPYEVWMGLAKEIQPLAKMCLSTEVSPQQIHKTFNYLKDKGIVLGLGAQKINYSKLLDQRATKSVNDLGFTKDKIVNCFRYVQIIGQVTNKKSIAAAKAATSQLVVSAHEQMDALDNKLKEGVSPESKEYKEIMKKLNALQAAYAGKEECIKVCYDVCDRLVKDLLNVGKVYEDAIMPKYVR